MTTPITAVELNYIVYRYLQESGFIHAAFNFSIEAGVNNSQINGNLVPQAALFQLVQKGLEYKEIEANADNADDDDFCLLQTMDLITKNVSELKKIVKGKKENPNGAGKKDSKKKRKERASCGAKQDKARRVHERQVTLIDDKCKGRTGLKRLRKKYS